MKILHDHEGLAIRLKDERLAHMPERVVQSFSDPEARPYYRFYFGTLVGDKHLCVVVTVAAGGAFVLTAYLTDRIKKGVTRWPREE